MPDSSPHRSPDTAPDPLAWLGDELANLEQRGLRRQLKQRRSPQTAAWEEGGRRVVNFSANDYLGLAADPRLAEAALAATQDGWGSGASPLVTGRSVWHARLETRLAEFEGAEAALLFPTGFAAGMGVIPALVGRGDAILADAKNHACLIDGCRLATAERHIYPHNDVDALASLLEACSSARRRLIVTDGLFSMDGDLAPLDRIASLARRHDAMLLVDEAHATGVLGLRGRGTLEHFGVDAPETAVIKTGTLSKAIGSLGGFACGSRELVDWLANRARSYVFSTAAPASVAAAGLAALEIVAGNPGLGGRLLAQADHLRSMLREAGFETGTSTTQIVPVLVGDPERAVRWSQRLEESGLLVPAIRPPTVPPGESLLRVSVCLGHSEEDFNRLVAALHGVRDGG
ncbi:MAG: 8-amino-7-oxononanoate synthase [Planctomycetota bacterium]